MDPRDTPTIIMFVVLLMIQWTVIITGWGVNSRIEKVYDHLKKVHPIEEVVKR